MSKKIDVLKPNKVLTAYIIYVVVLAMLILFFMMYCFKSMTLYEEAQPKYLMEQIVSDIAANGLTQDDLEGMEFSEENPAELYLEEMNALVASSRISYLKMKENYSDGSLVYNLYANGLKFAQVTLVPESSYNRMYLLTITNWRYGGLTLAPYRQDYSAKITVPENYEVTINGKALTRESITDTQTEPALSYCREYVDIPDIVTYETGSYSHPLEIEIFAEDGKILYCSGEMPVTAGDLLVTAKKQTPAGEALTLLEYGYAAPTIPTERKEMVLEGVERYSLFFSRDLPGGLESIEPIKDLFPEDSVYLTLADRYRREDIRVFSSHSNTHFENESVTEYTVYSRDCFSCRVRFDKSMTLGGSREMIDSTDNTYYYVKENDRFVIADIQE